MFSEIGVANAVTISIRLNGISSDRRGRVSTDKATITVGRFSRMYDNLESYRRIPKPPIYMKHS